MSENRTLISGDRTKEGMSDTQWGTRGKQRSGHMQIQLISVLVLKIIGTEPHPLVMCSHRWHKNTTEQWRQTFRPAMHKIFTMKLFMEKFNQPAIEHEYSCMSLKRNNTQVKMNISIKCYAEFL